MSLTGLLAASAVAAGLLIYSAVTFSQIADRAVSSAAASDARQLETVQTQAAQLGYDVVSREHVGQKIDPNWLTVTNPGWIEVVLKDADGRIVVARQEGSELVMDEAGPLSPPAQQANS